MPAIPPDEFRTARLLIRPIEAGDAEAIFSDYARDEDVTKFMSWRRHRGRDDTDAYIAACLATPPTTARNYVMTGRDNGRLLGACDLRMPAPYRLGFGYVLARRWWGMGLMTEALSEMVDWASRQSGIFRIESFCDVENVASARVMEKAGLSREALLRRYMVAPNISDEPRDCFGYARVK